MKPRVKRALGLWSPGSERAPSATPAQYLEALFRRWSEIGYTQPLLERTVRGDLLELKARRSDP